MDKINNLFEHIRKAKYEADKRLIKANTVVIDTHVAMVNSMWIDERTITSPTICGLRIEYANNLRDDLGFNFMLVNRNLKEEKEELEERIKLLEKKIKALKEILGEDE